MLPAKLYLASLKMAHPVCVLLSMCYVGLMTFQHQIYLMMLCARDGSSSEGAAMVLEWCIVGHRKNFVGRLFKYAVFNVKPTYNHCIF